MHSMLRSLAGAATDLPASPKTLHLVTWQQTVTGCGENLQIVGKLRQKYNKLINKLTKIGSANWFELNDTAEVKAVNRHVARTKNGRKLLRILYPADLKKLKNDQINIKELSIPVPPHYRDSFLYSRWEAKSSPDPRWRKRRSGQEKKSVKLKYIVLYYSNEIDLSANQGLVAAAKAKILFFLKNFFHLMHSSPLGTLCTTGSGPSAQHA